MDYQDRIEPFDPDADYSAILTMKDIQYQRLMKTLDKRTSERNGEYQRRIQLEAELETLKTELEAAKAKTRNKSS